MDKNLKSLKNDELLVSTQTAVSQERHWSLEVIHHFREIFDRKLYLEKGFSSLFEMMTVQYKFSPGSAQRRIESMRLMKDVPALEAKFENGEISLCVTASVQRFLKLEEKEDRAYSKSEKLDLIEECQGKSLREVEKELASRNPAFARRESVQVVGEDRVRLSLSISDELREKLDQLKALLSHKNPQMSYEELLNELAEIGLKKLDPAQGKSKLDPAQEKHKSLPALEVEDRTRHIPAAVRQ